MKPILNIGDAVILVNGQKGEVIDVDSKYCKVLLEDGLVYTELKINVEKELKTANGYKL